MTQFLRHWGTHVSPVNSSSAGRKIFVCNQRRGLLTQSYSSSRSIYGEHTPRDTFCHVFFMVIHMEVMTQSLNVRSHQGGTALWLPLCQHHTHRVESAELPSFICTSYWLNEMNKLKNICCLLKTKKYEACPGRWEMYQSSYHLLCYFKQVFDATGKFFLKTIARERKVFSRISELPMTYVLHCSG